MCIDDKEKVRSRCREDLRRPHGQSLVEYGLFIGLVVIVVVGILSGVGTQTSEVFVGINSGLTKPTSGPTGPTSIPPVVPTSPPATAVPPSPSTAATTFTVVVPVSTSTPGGAATATTGAATATTGAATATTGAATATTGAATATTGAATATTGAATATTGAATATTGAATATAVPPTATTVPPTATTVPPTATTVPPTATVPAIATVPATATTVPATATSNGKCIVPDLSGMTVSAAKEEWRVAGFTGSFNYGSMSLGDIVDTQSQTAGGANSCGSTSITVYPVPPQCIVPDLIGTTYSQAQTAWTNAGFTGSVSKSGSSWNNNSTPITRQSVVKDSSILCTSSITVYKN